MRMLMACLLCLPTVALGQAGSGVVVDGQTEDWVGREDVVLLGDDLVLRLRAREEVSLHALPQPLVVELDLDADPATGEDGTDARVTFSPERSRDGVRIEVIDRTGFASPRTTLDADLAISPSFAGREFEVRIDPRRLAELAGVPLGDAVRGRIETPGSVFDRRSFEVQSTEAEPLPTPIPAKPADAIRVVSFNVERAAPMTEPEPFAKLMRVIGADVYLLQEWDDVSPDDLRAWFTRNVERGPWHAATGPVGVAIVSRYPLEDAAAPLDDVRLVAAVARTPMGPVTLASMHLKCCGSPGSSEDQRRIEETRAIADALGRIRASRRQQMIVGGDLNLVGTQTPLLQLIDNLDADRSDLQPVDTPVLGDRARYTWRHPAHPFSQGRLDYLAITDATLDPVQAFALDTWRLTELPDGLERSTSSASDHLPIVVDLVERDD